MNRLKSAVILTALILLIGMSDVQGRETQKPKIQLEEEEITLFDDNGKEVKKVYVGRSDQEKERVLDEVKEKILKKIGAKSFQEVRDKKMFKRYTEENKKFIRVKKIEHPKIKFFNKEGNIIKEIQLTTPEKPEIKEVKRKIHGLDKLVNEATNKKAMISKNKNFALLNKHQYVVKMEGGDIASLEYYDSEGNLLWNKQPPQNMGVGNEIMSDDGEIIAYIQGYIMGGLDENEPYEKLVIVNKQGNELMSFPKNRNEFRLKDDVFISPNGRYIGISGRQKNKEVVSIFFDTIMKKSWIAPKHYVINSISNEGIVNANSVTFNPNNLKDVKRTEETFGLKSVIGE